MKKYFIILVTLFLTAQLSAQDKGVMIGSITEASTSKGSNYVTINSKESYGVYVENNTQIKLKTVYINIRDDKYSKESFELKIMSAPPMNSGQIYKEEVFTMLNSDTIICRADKGGILEIDIEKYNINTDKSFIIEIASTDESIKYARFTERKIYEYCSVTSGVKDSGKTEKIAYYGSTILRYKKHKREIFDLLISNRKEYVCRSNRRLNIPPAMIALEVEYSNNTAQ